MGTMVVGRSGRGLCGWYILPHGEVGGRGVGWLGFGVRDWEGELLVGARELGGGSLGLGGGRGGVLAAGLGAWVRRCLHLYYSPS